MPNANQLASIWKKLHHERCGPVIGNEVVTCVNGRNPNGKIIEPIYLQPGRGRLHYITVLDSYVRYKQSAPMLMPFKKTLERCCPKPLTVKRCIE
jgi:hypothetical protein